jgi:TolA-binding protein
MSDDVLSRATRALREETAGDDASARFTRSRIMASVHEERVKRRTRWAFLIPIAATFIAASAYGAATGKTRAAILVVVRALGIHHGETPAPPRSARRSPAPTANAPAVAQHAPPLAAAAEPPPGELAPTPPPSRPVRSGALAPIIAAAAPARSLPGVGGAAAADPTFDLYRAAHQAHFVDHDYARALGAWDAYLKSAPSGALAPEARYNRALCLVRLHRNDEARAALKPFAAGQYGTYRRADAEKLIAALPGELLGP